MRCSAAAFVGAGSFLQAHPEFLLGSHTISTFVAHGMVGGLSGVIQGGHFGAGFLAAGIGSLAPAPVANETDAELTGHTVEAAILGGAGSILGGGKFQNGAITGAFGYLFATCAQGGCAGNSSNEVNGANNANGTQQQNIAGTPDKLIILNPQGDNQGNYSTYYYQLEDQNGNALTGSGYGLEEDITVANDNTPPSINSNGTFVNMTNGVAADNVGWVNVTPPQNADWTYNQTFTVEYQSQVYPLTSEFQHENISVNGNVTNIVKVIKQ